MGISFLHWNGYQHLRPAPVCRIDLQFPSDNSEALAHADQAEALFPSASRDRRRIKARAFVTYVTVDRTGLSLKSNPDRSCPSVLDHVVQLLLGDVVQGRFNAPRQPLVRYRIDADLQTRALSATVE